MLRILLLFLLILPSPLRAAGEKFLAQYCYDCHGEKKAKGDLTLHDLDFDIAKGDEVAIWRLVAEQVEFHDMPPEEEAQPTAAERKKFLQWIGDELTKAQKNGRGKIAQPEFGNEVDHALLFGKNPGPVIPGPPRLWRLRGDFYQTLMDRVSDGAKGLSAPLADRGKPGIQDYAVAFEIDEATLDMLYRNAESVVDRQLTAKGSRFKNLTKLQQDEAGPDDFSKALDQQFDLALRRNPTAKEKERFLKFWQNTSTKLGKKEATKALLVAVLMQPEVYYREELGAGPVDELGRRRLSPDEIARSLSHALGNRWENDFFKAASEGKLATCEQVAHEVRQILESPKKDHSRLMQFFREYFGYEAAREVFKDDPTYGVYHPTLMVSDLEHLIEWVLEKDKEVLKTLLTTDRAFINWSYSKKDKKGSKREKNPSLFDYGQAFGLPPDWQWTHQQPITLTGPRRGVLMHPAWLAAYSGNFDTDPVKRGKWIRFQLLGGTVPDVPIGVDARIPEDPHLTLRARLHSATSAQECWRCHRKMDPLGLPFEQFDHYSQMRRFELGKPVDTSGAITRTGVKNLDGLVADPFELIDRLANSEHVEQVFIRHVFRYFLGRNETPGDAATLQNAQLAYRESGGSFRELVISILSSDSFLYRKSKP